MELLHAIDIDGRLPWELARDCGHDELASYLFCRTVRFEIGRLSTMPFQGLSWLTALQRTHSPLEGLQSLSQDLEGDMDEMMEKLQGVMMECKEVLAQHKDIKFPQDLVKSVDPIVPWTDEEVGVCVRICTRL
jgi:hypothetical protein